MTDYSTNRMSIALAVQIFITHLIAGGVGVYVILGIDLNDTNTEIAIFVTIVGLAGLIVSLTLQRSVRQLDLSLRRLAAGLPVEEVSLRWHGPLRGMVSNVQQLVEEKRPLHDLHTRELQQASEIAAQEERHRLARDLHDSIKQQLFSIQVSAAAAQARWYKDPDGAKTAVSDARQSAQAALVEMNALLQQLAEHPLETIGLGQALREQAEALSYRTGAKVDVNIAPLPDNERFPLHNREALFRIAQEAMGNIARHARAQHVTISLKPDMDHIHLLITDDGQGFNEKNVHAGMGLANMRQRAAEIGGEAAIKSQVGQGTTIQFMVPLIETVAMKEQKLQQPNHTINRVGIAGLLGGLVTAALLFYPMYVLLLGRYVDNWQSGSAVLGWLTTVVGIFALVGAGYWAAHRTPYAGGKRVLLGASGGVIAGMVAYMGMVGAATAVLGSRTLLQHGMVASETNEAFMILMVNNTAGTIFWIVVGLWISLLAGCGLGCVGGWLAAWRGEVVKRPSSTMPIMPVLSATWFSIMTSSFATYIITTAILVLLGPQVAEAAIENSVWRPGSITIVQFVETVVIELSGRGGDPGLTVLYPPLLSSWLPILSTQLIFIGSLAGMVIILRQMADSADKKLQLRILDFTSGSALFGGASIVIIYFLITGEGSLRTVVLIGSSVIWGLSLLLLRMMQNAETHFYPKKNIHPYVSWLRNSPIPVMVLAYPLVILGQAGVAFWLLIITAVLVIILVPRDLSVRKMLLREMMVDRFAWIISLSVGVVIAISLPLLIPVVIASGVIQLIVYSIPYIGAEPYTGTLSSPDLLTQINNLYLYNGSSLLIVMLLGLLLLGISATVLLIATSLQKRRDK